VGTLGVLHWRLAAPWDVAASPGHSRFAHELYPKIVSERLGHASIEMTLDRYQHVSAELQQAAAEALSARLIGPGLTPAKATKNRA